MASSSRYRRQVKSVILKKYWKRWFYSNRNQIHPATVRPISSIELE
jgi:hypothetical protein